MRSRSSVAITRTPLQLVHVALVLAVGLMVTYYSVVFHGPLPDHPWLMGWNDTFLHVCSFGLLTLLVLPLARAWRAALLVLAASAVAIEAIQVAVPVRTASLGDLAASLTGVALGAVGLTIIQRGAQRLMLASRGRGG